MTPPGKNARPTVAERTRTAARCLSTPYTYVRQQQYAQMLLLIWMGARLEGEALVRFERLQRVYGRTTLAREVYAA